MSPRAKRRHFGKPNLPHVLVVGGGFAGTCAAETLVRSWPQVTVTLVASQDYFEFLPSSLRCMVHPTHIESITCGLSGRRFEFIHGTVTSMSRHSAVVQEHSGDVEFVKTADNGHLLLEVTFSYCIWAAGVAYPAPVKTFPTLYNLPHRRTELVDSRAGLLKARRILVIGGGLVGVEMAAELAAGLPNPESRQIVIATSSRGLLPRMPEYARNYAMRWFQDRGVQIILSRVKYETHTQSDDNEMRSFQREDGLPPIRADLAFECTGGWRGSGCSALAAGGVAAEEEMNSYGQISVRDTLQFIRAPHIFAAGDCALVAGELDRSGAFAEKTAYAAMEAGRLAARNVGAMIVARGKTSRARLETFPRNAFPLGMFPRLFAVSLYKRDGLLCIGPLVMTGSFAAFGKWFTEVLGCAAMTGNRFFEYLFSAVEKIIFFVTVIVQFLFIGQE